MTRFYFALAVLLLMGFYQAIVTVLGAHVVGFELPPAVVFALVSISPVLLLVANGLPALYSLLPNATGSVPSPSTTHAAAAVAIATEVLADRTVAAPLAAPAAPPPA
jgi:hypothetical protein